MRKTRTTLTLALALLVPGVAHADDVRLTVKQAVRMALEHNLSLKRERQSPSLSTGPEQVADAPFEPELFAEATASHSPGQVSRQRAGLAPTASTNVMGEVGMRKSFSTGTSAELSLSSAAMFGGGVLDPAYQSGVALTARQSLLEGISRSANEEALAAARLSRREARQKLRHQAEQVVADTLEAYFDLQAALAQDAVEALAIKTSETTLKDTRTLIAGGRLPGSEEISARYTLQTYRRAKLKTRQAVADARDRLARLVGLVKPDSLATPRIVTVETTPALPSGSDLRRLQAVALRQRGDYLAALSQVELQRVRVEASRHRLWPRLDLVGSVFATGLSGDESSGVTTGVEGSYWASYKMDQVGWSAGLSLSLPLGNRQARGELKSAELELGRARTAADIVKQTIAEELNRAFRAVQLARDQLKLIKTAEEVARMKLRSEEALYRTGKTTAHLLAAVQAEVVKERLARAQAEADLSKALVKLHATAGNLLARLGLGV
jgi:outer membrane protein TolC